MIGCNSLNKAALVLSALVCLVLVSCGVGTPAAATAVQPAGGPVSGGEITFGYRETATSFDPQATQDRINARVMINVCDSLVVRGPDRKFYSNLAESWEISPDGKTYTFKLKKGVKFHDGTPFNAEAVKFNLDRVADPANKLLTFELLGPYQSTDIVDELTVRVNLTKPFAPLMDGLSKAYMGMVSPAAVKKWGDTFAEHVVGTGPFVAQEIVTTSYVKLAKNPDYNWAPPFFKHQGPAYLDKVTYKFIPEEGTRLGTLESGETDIVDGLGPTSLKTLEGNSKFYVGRAPYGGTPRTAWLNTSLPPTDNVAVRRAMNYATNKQEIVDTLYKGIMSPAQAPLSKATFGFNPDVNMYPFGLAKVKEVMTADGWTLNSNGIWEKDGKPIHLVYLNLGGYGLDELATMIQGQLIKAGFDVEVRTEALAAWSPMVKEGKVHNLVPTMGDATDPTILRSMYSESMIGTSLNRSRVRGNAQLEKLLQEQDAESDLNKREELIKQIQGIIMDQAYTIPLYDSYEVYGIKANIQDISFDPATHALLYDVWIKR